MTDCSKCAIQKRLNENTDTKNSNTDAMSRVIFEKINKLSGNNYDDEYDKDEENEMNACVKNIMEEKGISKETAIRMCGIINSNKKKKKKNDY